MNFTERQNEIIDAALSLTASGGIQKLTVRNLSAAIGVTEPAIYRHFKNKAEIIQAMISRFDQAVSISETSKECLDAIKIFIRGRIEQVCQTPDLARVVFAEELFFANPVYQASLLQMMHRHKISIQKHFRIGRKRGEIRTDIEEDILFRLVFGPLRLIIKQWGMSGQAFDLRVKGEELLDAIVKILSPSDLPKEQTKNKSSRWQAAKKNAQSRGKNINPPE